MTLLPPAFGTVRHRVRAQGGMFYIERRWLWWWFQQYDMCIDGLMMPRAFFNEQAARRYCTNANDSGRILT